MIANWLKDKYEEKVYLTGILYLHRITDNRMAGTPLRNLRVFGKLCGGEEEVGKRVVFVTTMWDKLRTQEKGEKREGELMQYWSPMLDIGASTSRFDDTKISAEKIVNGILRHQRGHRPVLLQEEMVDHSRQLSETEAAQTLYTQYQSLLSQHKATLLEIEKAVKRSADETALLDLEKQRKGIEEELERTYAQAKKIKAGVAHRITTFFRKPPKRGLSLGVTSG
ncbi:hypothetical protein CPB83DRAFT_858503 [Crepidotus variabilis]|uniref:Uncharacterized protein n=1 Tax=Crepidotus variabilis TaxID=179855 RepID=A0A9P6EBG1_9AGAR|nr:hypothetical protein CPB83DRAFT_858503 [Crepidotus variabilis]